MKKHDITPISTLIRQYLREENLETPLNEHRLISAWPELMGQFIASYTTGLSIRNQILYVHVTSAALRQELMMGRKLMVDRLNRYVGAQVITDIVIK